MLDVFHVFLEEDMIPRFDDEPRAKSAVRRVIYGDLYKREYRYGVSETPNYGDSMDSEFGNPANLPPDQLPVKGYIPPTNPEDFSAILDGPLG